MNPSEMPGAVEVVVICAEGAQLNGPDHRTLGWIETGQHAFTHESYLPHLREHGIACLPSDINIATMEMEAELADLTIALQSAEAEENDESDGEIIMQPVSKSRGGRPSKAK